MKVFLCFIFAVMFVVLTEKFGESFPGRGVPPVAEATVPQMNYRRRIEGEKHIIEESSLWPSGSSGEDTSTQQPTSITTMEQTPTAQPDPARGASDESHATKDAGKIREQGMGFVRILGPVPDENKNEGQDPPAAKGPFNDEVITTHMAVLLSALILVIAYFKCGALPKRADQRRQPIYWRGPSIREELRLDNYQELPFPHEEKKDEGTSDGKKDGKKEKK